MSKYVKAEHAEFLPLIGLIIASFLWGSSFIVNRIALDSHLTAPTVLSFRFILATVIMSLVFRKELKHLTKDTLIAGFVLGAVQVVAFYLQTVGLKYTTPANNAFITSTIVIMVPFINWIVLKEKPKLLIIISAIICFVGVVILSVDLSSDIKFGLGDLLSLLCAVFFAIHTIVMSYYVKRYNTNLLLIIQFLTAGVISLVMLLFEKPNFDAINYMPAISSLMYLTVLCTCVAYMLKMNSLKSISPSIVSIVLSTEALFATALSVMLGYDKMKSTMVIGGSLIMLAVIVPQIQWNKKKELVTETHD